VTNDAYKARFNGQDNPNVALIHELKQAGVDFRVCGQGLLGRKIEQSQLLPDIQGGPLGDDDDGQPAVARLRADRRVMAGRYTAAGKRRPS
jgi:hypothetical protein